LKGRRGEIFNLKCLVQFLEGEWRGGEQIFLKFDCIAIIIGSIFRRGVEGRGANLFKI